MVGKICKCNDSWWSFSKNQVEPAFAARSRLHRARCTERYKPAQHEELLAFIALYLCSCSNFFDECLSRTTRLRKILFRAGVIWPRTGRCEGSVGCTDPTLSCRLYFQPLGLLQGWHLHPNSASYLSTWTVSEISPPASESRFQHLLNYGPKCSFPGQGTPAHSPFSPYPKIPCSMMLLNTKTRESSPLESQHNLLHFPKTFASGWGNTWE